MQRLRAIGTGTGVSGSFFRKEGTWGEKMRMDMSGLNLI